MLLGGALADQHRVAPPVDREHAAGHGVVVLRARLGARAIALRIGTVARLVVGVLVVLVIIRVVEPAHQKRSIGFLVAVSPSIRFHSSTNWGSVFAVVAMSSTSIPSVTSPIRAPAVAMRWSS